jgi:biotin carboxyl carrier protein
MGKVKRVSAMNQPKKSDQYSVQSQIGDNIVIRNNFTGVTKIINPQLIREEKLRLDELKTKKNTGIRSSSSHGDQLNPIIKAPMPGKVYGILKKVGDKVKKNEKILIMEAMKMEHALKSPFEGEIEGLFCSEHDLVAKDQVLVKVKV